MSCIKRETTYKGFDGDWTLTVDCDDKLIVSKFGESRVYDLEHRTTKFEHDHEYVFLETEDGGFYQFKFEENHFFVGDLFDKDGTHLGSVACHVFDEE